MKSADSPGELWLDDVSVDGDARGLRRRTRDGKRSATVAPTSRRTCVRASTSATAPPTSPAARPPGEVGGLVFRGDIREAARMACLRRSGRPALARSAVEGLGQGRAAAGGERQHDPVRLLPLRAEHGGQPVPELGVPRRVPRPRGRGPEPRGVLRLPRLPDDRRSAGLRPGPGPPAHPPRRQTARLVPGLRPRPPPAGGDRSC